MFLFVQRPLGSYVVVGTGCGRGSDRDHSQVQWTFCKGDYKQDLEGAKKQCEELVKEQSYRSYDEYTDYLLQVLRLNLPVEKVCSVMVPEGTHFCSCFLAVILFLLSSGGIEQDDERKKKQKHEKEHSAASGSAASDEKKAPSGSSASASAASGSKRKYAYVYDASVSN